LKFLLFIIFTDESEPKRSLEIILYANNQVNIKIALFIN